MASRPKTKKTTAPKIPLVKWRDGRPRWDPSPTLRAEGWQGEDLRHPDGTWMTAGEALDFAQARRREIDARTAGKAASARRKPKAKPLADKLILEPVYTLGDLYRDWLTPEKNPRMAERAEKTVHEYRLKESVIRQHLPDAWESQASHLTKPYCLTMYDILLTKVGVAQASSTMRAIGTALQWGIDRDRIPGMLVNPAHKLGLKAPPPRLRVASVAEFEHLVSTADKLGRPEMGDMFTLGVWTGQRQADRLELELHGRAGGRIQVRQGKTGAIVSIPEAERLTARLDAAASRRKVAGRLSPRIVLNERTWEPFSGDEYRKLFDKIRRVAQKTMPSIEDLRDQDFRDTAVTWLANAGATLFQICAITGHEYDYAARVLRHYLAVNPQLADAAIVKLSAFYESELLKDTKKEGE